MSMEKPIQSEPMNLRSKNKKMGYRIVAKKVCALNFLPRMTNPRKKKDQARMAVVRSTGNANHEKKIKDNPFIPPLTMFIGIRKKALANASKKLAVAMTITFINCLFFNMFFCFHF
jgi:hypothetical protein